jgi:hypothetical protein
LSDRDAREQKLQRAIAPNLRQGRRQLIGKRPWLAPISDYRCGVFRQLPKNWCGPCVFAADPLSL